MPATWDETRWALFGVYLREDGWKLKDAEKVVNCSDTAIKQATRVRRYGDKSIWRLMVDGQVTVGDAWGLVKGLQVRLNNNPQAQRIHQLAAVRRLEAGEIKYLGDYLRVVSLRHNSRVHRNSHLQSELSVLP